MDARRAQDLLKHITQDEDYGLKAMQKASLAECISMVNNVLPECQKKAYEDGNDNDAGFFSKMTENYRALIIDKIKEENLLWIAYTDLTGYPYMIDGDMIVIYDFAAAKQIEETSIKQDTELHSAMLTRMLSKQRLHICTETVIRKSVLWMERWNLLL